MYVSDSHRFYYLQNFHRALDWLHCRYDDVLQPAERTFIEQFVTLPEPSRALLARMVMRKGAWFRTSKLAYDEIGCPVIASQALIACG